jgi:hypothetical protein
LNPIKVQKANNIKNRRSNSVENKKIIRNNNTKIPLSYLLYKESHVISKDDSEPNLSKVNLRKNKSNFRKNYK